MKWFGITRNLIPRSGFPVRKKQVQDEVERLSELLATYIYEISVVEDVKKEWVKRPGEEERDNLEDILLACNLVRELEQYGIYLEVEYSQSKKKEYLLKELGRQCQGCYHRFRSAKSLEVDHIIPVSDGRLDYLCNATLLCKPCNLRKGNRFTLSGLRAENKRLGKLEDY